MIKTRNGLERNDRKVQLQVSMESGFLNSYCSPYLIMAAIMVLIWKHQTMSRLQEPLGRIMNKSDGVYEVRWDKDY